MLKAFTDLVTKDQQEGPRMLGDLRLLGGVRRFPQRVKCAMLAWRAFEQSIAESPGIQSVSTE
jgi:nitrogen fixation NifU-like protein